MTLCSGKGIWLSYYAEGPSCRGVFVGNLARASASQSIKKGHSYAGIDRSAIVHLHRDRRRWLRIVDGPLEPRLAEQFIDFAGTTDREKVLDLGCGTGSLSFALATRAPNSAITGIDFSQAYVAYATRKNTEARLVFEGGDACAMPYADKSFDRVLSLLVLHYVREPHKAIAEMRRVARPGATVAATVWDARGGFVGDRIFFDTAVALDPAAETHRSRYYTHPMTRPGELAGAWRDAGFQDVREGYLTIRMEFKDFADYWAPVTGKDGPVAAYVNSLAADTRERFKAALVCRERLGRARHRTLSVKSRQPTDSHEVRFAPIAYKCCAVAIFRFVLEADISESCPPLQTERCLTTATLPSGFA